LAKVASKYTNGDSCSDSRYVEFNCALKNHFNTQSNKNMNAKQTAPLLTTLPAIGAAAPPLIIGGAIGLGIVLVVKWLLSDDDKEKKLETLPANAKTKSRRKEAETLVFRPIPVEIPCKPAIITSPTAPKPFITPLSVASVPKIPVTQSPPPIKKKFVTREDLAAVFHHGAHPLTRIFPAAFGGIQRFLLVSVKIKRRVRR
jgi:hypothetical protein